MSHTKKQGRSAFETLTQWKESGVPELVTSYEAHRLTGGIVGKPNSAQALRLIDVAMELSKKGARKC
jgi:hypothetical protein